MKKGFTLFETLVTIAISLVIIGFTVGAFYTFKSAQTVDKERNLLNSLITKAEKQTQFEENGYTYGVYFTSTQAVLFRGSTYSSTDPNNQVLKFDPSITLSGIHLTGGVTQVLFNNDLTGEPNATGTLVLTVTGSNPPEAATTTIDSSGIIE